MSLKFSKKINLSDMKAKESIYANEFIGLCHGHWLQDVHYRRNVHQIERWYILTIEQLAGMKKSELDECYKRMCYIATAVDNEFTNGREGSDQDVRVQRHDNC